MQSFATPAPGPNYAQNAQYLMSQGFRVPTAVAGPPRGILVGQQSGLRAGPPPIDPDPGAAERAYRQQQEQQAAWQRQQQMEELQRYRLEFPGLGDAQLMQAINLDRARQAQNSQESWIERYGSPYQQQELTKRRAQVAATPKTNEDWMAQQNKMNAAAGAPPVSTGRPYGAFSPGQAQPIQQPGRGTPYGMQ